ncbi:hypothetical protein AURDEDRAFT_159921 [Auricularia subglabra TFB-10046 SS5]|nr:hypothetical protein AURDEDRAFT_159921 [Auricularia subglabra TFB-10046 SS5]
MVMTEDNSPRLKVLAHNDASAHVFRAVRCLVATPYALESWDDGDLLRLFGGVVSINAAMARVQVLAQSHDFRPCALAVRFHLLATFVDHLPLTTLAYVTHLLGYCPNSSDDRITLTADCIAHLLSTMPALTHLAFDVVELNKSIGDNSDTDSDSEGEPLDLSALEVALRAALSYSRIHVVALRVGADWLVDWPAVLNLAVKLCDSRVLLWKDARPMRSWAGIAAHAASDAWAGRNIWTEARQVRWHQTKNG